MPDENANAETAPAPSPRAERMKKHAKDPRKYTPGGLEEVQITGQHVGKVVRFITQPRPDGTLDTHKERNAILRSIAGDKANLFRGGVNFEVPLEDVLGLHIPRGQRVFHSDDA